MNIIADLHTHTIASTHAYATATEMIKAAADMNLYAIALTDHGRKMPGSPGAYYFDSLSAIPSRLFGVRVLKGIEANIIDYKGNLDTDANTTHSLDWVVASMHANILEGNQGVDTCTETWLNVAKNPDVNVIGHSGSPEFRYDYEKVIPEFARNGKLVEINNGSFRFRKSSMSNCIEIAKICKKVGARIVVNTDAHFWTVVGHAEEALKMLDEIDFPKELIVNAQEETIKAYLCEKNIPLE
ncbi:MAG: phosphatase [Bacillota bacterium]|nr:phosphatase [Bacillota bacterium]